MHSTNTIGLLRSLYLRLGYPHAAANAAEILSYHSDISAAKLIEKIRKLVK